MQVPMTPKMHLNSFKGWNLNDSVKKEVEKTCFKYFLDITDINIRQNCTLIDSIVKCYIPKKHCFKFGEQYVDFGLEDILYITGLPIDGTQVFLIFTLFN